MDVPDLRARVLAYRLHRACATPCAASGWSLYSRTQASSRQGLALVSVERGPGCRSPRAAEARRGALVEGGWSRGCRWRSPQCRGLGLHLDPGSLPARPTERANFPHSALVRHDAFAPAKLRSRTLSRSQPKPCHRLSSGKRTNSPRLQLVLPAQPPAQPLDGDRAAGTGSRHAQPIPPSGSLDSRGTWAIKYTPQNVHLI